MFIKMKTKLTKEELMTQYGLGSGMEKAGCTITLNCAFGSISCSSDKGDCQKHKDTFQLSNGETIELVTSISCDGQSHDCK